jgi:hypothetical protein
MNTLATKFVAWHRRFCFEVLQLYSSTALQFYSSTALQLYGYTAIRLYGYTAG